MSRTLVLTESQYNNLLKRVDEESFIVEDYADDLKKRMQAANKQTQINQTKCPTGYKQLTQKEVSSYTQTIKPWQDTRRGDKAFIQLSNGIVCQSFRSEKYTEAKKITLDQLVESLRSGMGSLEGIIVQVLLDLVPTIGPILNVSAWSLLAAYDINKAITKNQWNATAWFNIIVDLVGIVTTGPGAFYAKKALSGVKNLASGSLKAFLSNLKRVNPNGFKYIFNTLKTVSSWISKVMGPISRLIEALATKMKGTSLYNSLVTLKNSMSKIHKIIHEVEGNLLLLGAKTVEKVGEKWAEHQVVHAGAAKITGHSHGSGHGTKHASVKH